MATTTKALKNPYGFTQTGKLTYDNTEKYIDIKGVPGGSKDTVRIHYHEAGTQHPDTMVFLHGGGLGASGWFNFYLNIEPFAEHFRTILFDMPNFGRSDAVVINRGSGEYDSDILSEFLKAKGIKKASLMGNSKGGGDAIAFSVRHPDQLDLLVLMGAATGPSIMDVMPPAGTAQLAETLNNPSRENVEKFLHLFVYDDSFVNAEYVDLRWKSVQDQVARGFRDARLKSATVRANYTGELYKVPNPTLVIYGAHDRFAALDSSVSLMRHYPNSQLHIFRNCGHWVQFELSEEFNDLVVSWMKREKAKQAAA